jgi:hypothetical protein
MIRRSILIALTLLLFQAVAPYASAATSVQQSDVGFVNSTIWFSRSNFSAGDQVRIYTTVKNSSAADLRGTVVFYANDSQIGTSDFSLAAGASAVVSARFTAQEGLQSYSARIKNTSAVLDDGTSQSVADSGTPPVQLSVAPPVIPPEPPQGPVASLADTVLATLPDMYVDPDTLNPAPGPARGSASAHASSTAQAVLSTSTASAVTVALEHLESNKPGSLLQAPAHYAKLVFQAADSLLDKTISSLAHAASSIRIADKKALKTLSAVGASGTSTPQQLPASDSALALVYAFLAKVLTFKTIIYALALYLIYKIAAVGIRLARGA